MDHDADMHIHSVIFSEQCAKKTILMIAHRLDRVLDFDLVILLKNGTVIEYDSPKHLIQDKQSEFYKIAKEAKIVG